MIIQVSKWAAIVTIVCGIPVAVSIIASPFSIIHQVQANTDAITTIQGTMAQNHKQLLRDVKEMRITHLQETVRTLEVMDDLSPNEKYRLNEHKDAIERLKRELERL